MFIGALYLLFGLRELGLSPLLVGITVGIGGASNLLGTLLVQRITHRFGVSPTMVGAASAASPTTPWRGPAGSPDRSPTSPLRRHHRTAIHPAPKGALASI